ncbi:MAG: hypothetical protein MJ113_02230 [Lachnospiraceae bacterium]|nr:hypothetical protein [Lachnospiraceae bacterium]
MSELICENIKTLFAFVLFILSLTLLITISDRALKVIEKRRMELINPYKCEYILNNTGDFYG